MYVFMVTAQLSLCSVLFSSPPALSHALTPSGDTDYVEINRVEYLGERGTFSDVNKETADVSWRSTVVLHGPAYRRKREKYLKNRPPKVVYQVSAAEEERVAEEKKTISQWNLFLKNNKLLERGFPPEVPETKAQRLERERREWEEEKVVLRQQGEFKLTRDPVDELQLKASLVDWDYGIYRIWDILKNPLPGECTSCFEVSLVFHRTILYTLSICMLEPLSVYP